MTNLVDRLKTRKPVSPGEQADVPHRPNWLLGHSPSRIERLLVGVTVVAGASVVFVSAVREDVSWAWWQWLIVAVIAVDMVGGPVANSLRGAKLLYHSPLPDSATAVQRLLHNRIGFTVIHVQPFVVTAVLPGHAWVWAAAVYGIALVGVAAVVFAPADLARPVAFAAVTIGLVILPVLAAPAGMAWLGYVHIVKLVIAHAVPEDHRS